MKSSTLIIVILFTVFSVHSQAQIKYIVTAENGLNLRDNPDSSGDIIGKLKFGAQVEIVEKTQNSQVVNDNGKTISGTWVKIKVENSSYFISNEDFGYVFDGYLRLKSETIKDITEEVFEHKEFKDLSIKADGEPFFLRGDFFGDGVDDLVVLLKNSQKETKIGFIDYGTTTKVYLLGTENDPFKMTDYSWAGIFEIVKKSEPLWSNYEEDFIEFKNVPESKKLRLKYNALYLHAVESCGGGFVYWKDGKFNWLQQE